MGLSMAVSSWESYRAGLLHDPQPHRKAPLLAGPSSAGFNVGYIKKARARGYVATGVFSFRTGCPPPGEVARQKGRFVGAETARRGVVGRVVGEVGHSASRARDPEPAQVPLFLTDPSRQWLRTRTMLLAHAGLDGAKAVHPSSMTFRCFSATGASGILIQTFRRGAP
jgi:hypothetical protein